MGKLCCTRSLAASALLLAACGSLADRPTAGEAERAYERMVHERQVAAEKGQINVLPKPSMLARIDPADCVDEGGELHCPALIADTEDNAERDTHEVVLVMVQVHRSWRVTELRRR